MDYLLSFHFGPLMLGDGEPPVRTTTIAGRKVALGDFSHALLGILDAIAQPTERALQALAAGDRDGFTRRMERCEALGQHVFEAQTQH